jgi:hypothetical protein
VYWSSTGILPVIVFDIEVTRSFLAENILNSNLGLDFSFAKGKPKQLKNGQEERILKYEKQIDCISPA